MATGGRIEKNAASKSVKPKDPLPKKDAFRRPFCHITICPSRIFIAVCTIFAPVSILRF